MSSGITDREHAVPNNSIVRFQCGANAGHTIVNDYGKFALHTLPSGVFYGHTTSIIGNGVALNIPVFFKEYNEVVSRGVPAPKILISNRARKGKLRLNKIGYRTFLF